MQTPVATARIYAPGACDAVPFTRRRAVIELVDTAFTPRADMLVSVALPKSMLTILLLHD